MRKERLISSMLMLLMIASGGCLFEPREPDPPGEGEKACWIVPNSPKDVFSNLNCGLSSNSNSSYERSLHESYTMIPREEDRSALESSLGYDVFEGWNKETEMEVITRIKGDYQGKRSVHFGDENGTFDREDISTGEAEFEGPYTIVLNPGNGAPADTLSGKAVFKVLLSSQGWMLLEWMDIDVNGKYLTAGYRWGSLKGSG